jgi:hypothetical protein
MSTTIATALRRAAVMLSSAALGLLTGCAQVKLADPTPSVENIQKARAAAMTPVAVGDFKLASGKSPALDQGVSIRTNTFYSPFDNSLAKYLGETLRVDLQAAGLLDPAAGTTIRGELTESRVEAPSDVGQGVLAARFIVQREGKTSFDKEFKTTSSWASSFPGVVAIPEAVNQYVALYRVLVGQLLDDADFRGAVKR